MNESKGRYAEAVEDWTHAITLGQSPRIDISHG